MISQYEKFVSHSQHADDYIAWQLLNKKADGTVVEVGAFDGVHLSNSYSLAQLGWKSICIEPNPEIFPFLQKNRPDAKNINKAVVGDDSISRISFFSEEIGVLSGVIYKEEDVKRRYEKRGLTYRPPKEEKVSAITLSSILHDELLESIDVLSIDVEGFELEVLKGLDLGRHKISLLIIEANTTDESDNVKKFFSDYPEYLFLGNNAQNLFFINKRDVSKKNIRRIDLENYIPAIQVHPKGQAYVINSVPPSFQISTEAKKHLRYFGFL